MIVLLNGTSSSGKSSLAQALSQSACAGWALLSVDAHLEGFFAMCRASYTDLPRDPESQDLISDRLLEDLIRLFHTMILAYAVSGRNLLVDHVLERESWRQDWNARLTGPDSLLVGLDCSEAELLRREAQRQDREPGLWRQQLSQVHLGMPYDLRLDTSRLTVPEGAGQIAALISTKQSGRSHAAQEDINSKPNRGWI